MSVRKINKSWWVDFQIDGKRYRKRSPVNNRDGAVEYEAFLRQKIARGEPLNNPKEEVIIPTFKEFAWKWFDIYVKNNNKPSEIRTKQYLLKAHLVPHFGKFPLNKIDNLKIEEYKSKKVKEGRLALKTINNHLTILAKCLKTAEEWIGLESIPKIKKFKVPPQKYDFLSQDESRLLLSHGKGVWYDMVLVALKTGLRLGEVRGLNWSDINFKNKILTVNRALSRDIVGSPKSNKERHIPLTDEVCSILNSRQQTSKFVFTDENNKFLKHERCRRTLHRVCESAGLRKVGWHTLRHTFASHLVEAGASIKAIQELLGHSDIQTTMRYAHLSPSALKDTINLLEPSGISLNLCQYSVNGSQNLTKNPKITAQDEVKILANKSQKQGESPV